MIIVRDSLYISLGDIWIGDDATNQSRACGKVWGWKEDWEIGRICLSGRTHEGFGDREIESDLDKDGASTGLLVGVVGVALGKLADV